MYIADDLKNWSSSVELVSYSEVKWVMARPLPFYGYYGLWLRIKDAYQVLIGKADAVRWIGQ